MESFDSFIELFKRRKKERNNDDLTDILKNAPSYFKNLSTNDIDLALSIFLNDKTGLLHFLVDASNRNMESSIIEGFKLLSFILQQFYWLLDQYIVQIKKVCQSAIIGKSSQFTKAAAADCFESLVKMCPSDELKLNETVQALVKIFHLCKDIERAKYFKVLGSIARYNPTAISPSNSTTIFERVMNDFEERYSKSKSGTQPNELAIYFELLNNLLRHFSDQESIARTESYKTLYRYIKELSDIDINQQFKFVSRAGIALLGNHMSLFADYVYEDALYWHKILLKWTRFKGENETIASNTLSVYYKQMGVTLQHTKTETGRKILQHLMGHFKTNFMNDNQDLITLQSSIHGFGHMAGACKNYLSENEVVHMFSLIAQKTNIIYANNNQTNDLLENIAYYQEAMSEILLHVSEVSSDQLNSLSMLSLILIKRFPDLPITKHSLVVTSLMKTLCNIKQACGRMYEEFVHNLVYEGIIWSCSHMLFIDAEREREMRDLNERPICYKNYLPLWQPLLYRKKMMNINGGLTVLIQLFNIMIDTCVVLIKKLNLDVKNIDTSSEIEDLDIPIAVNDTDFRVFVNLVDLFVDILEKLDPVLMESKVNWFICEIIKKSNQNPLISGFYKLIHVVLKFHNSSFDSGEKKFVDETSKLLSKYLSDTIDRLSSFSGELQNSCFNMIFAMPVSIAENMLDRLVPAFKTAFSLGQSNFNIAHSALSTLEKWAKTIARQQMNYFLIEVVPSLESFLQSNESAVDMTQETLLNERKVIKNIVLADHGKTLQEFQRRILLFFGSLNSEVTLNLATERSSVNEALESNKNLLKYTLVYQDIHPDIYLDSILPRVIELVLNSTDRRTRVSACEVLHSIVMVMLGETLPSLASNPDRFLPVFKKICPVILRLGSDSDHVIQQLFCPLMIQLTHWYSSKMMLRSSETVHLIEILFNLLTYESNMALNDFCGVCLAEFVKWSIKQSTDAELQTSSTNIDAIISKIINFALHPSVQKRIGAAIAFNYLYAILRENDIIIDRFWLEILFCFIKSLDGCNSTQIYKSLKHIERVIDNKYELLNKESLRRMKPPEFKGTLLKDAVDWLLVQSGSLDPNCRSKSMELLGRLCKHIPVYGSVQKVFADYINSNGVRGLNQIILKDLHPKIETLAIEALTPLLRTLDCYIWILNENIINLDLLFTDKNANKDMIFNCIVNFIYFINVKIEENGSLLEFAKQYQDLQLLKCKVILKIFDFINVLLNKMDTATDMNLVPSFFWNDELYLLIATSIFKPEVMGFTSQTSEMTDSLPSRLHQLLDTFLKKLDHKHILQLRVFISKEIEKKYQDFLNFDHFDKLINGTNIILKNYLKGLIMLENFDESGKLYERSLNDCDSANKVMQIFNILKKEQYDKALVVTLESSDKEYFESSLEFLFLKCEPNTITTLLNIVDSKIELTHENMTTIFHGQYFMNLFGASIFKNLLKNINKIMDTLLSNPLKEKFNTVLIILEDLMSYIKKNKRSLETVLLSTLETVFVQKFSTFRNLITADERRKEKVMNVYSMLVQVSGNPSVICSERDELYSWIMQGLMGYLDLGFKTRMLNSFLPCIVDETAHKKRELINCLHKLKADYYPNNMNDLAKGSLDHFNLIASFQVLARHLPTLKSLTFFDCVIHLTIGNIQYLWDDGSSKYLTAYFDEISTDDAYKSLQILYKYFINTENYQAKLEILNNLLLKCIYCCNTDAIELFFQDNIKEIYQTISRGLVGNGCDLKNLIVSKIGCYNLIGIMFAKVSLEKLSSADSIIVKNASETIDTGKTLLQALNGNFLAVRELKSDNTETTELMRSLYCAAYNCSIAIVGLKCEERFYVFPFAENAKKSQFIWEKIIDTKREYRFNQDFKELPKEYKKLINIRKQSNLKHTHDHSYMKSYNLAASTLNEDLSCFDLYDANLRSHSTAGNNNAEEIMTLTFECDDLNDHECMAPICGIIKHIISRSNLPNDGENLTMPQWMKCFHSSLNTTMYYNVKFFMIKVIVNVQEVFKKYAKYFLTPILNFLVLHFRKHSNLNYVIKDILIMVLDWHTIALPSQNVEKQAAQNLLEMFIRNADSSKRHIYKYNIEFINMFVEAWQSCLQVPEGILNIRNASTKFTVRIILTFLSNNKQDSIALRYEVLEYLMNLFDDPDEELLSHVCNAFGLILNFLESKNDSETIEWIINNIKTSVIDKSQIHYVKYIKCIYEIHRFYPNIVNCCFKQLTSHYFKVNNSIKEKCLELLSSAMPNFTEKEIVTELAFIKFQDILVNKILSCQIVALKIIEKLLNILKPDDFLPLAQLIVPYYTDVSVIQREIVVNVFIAVYKKYNDYIEDSVAVDKLKHLSKHILLLGLLDTNECLQKKLLHFWTEDGNMANKSTERILEIFDMYDTDLESSHPLILPLMMLHLISQGPEYKKKMFSPLINCKFEDYQVTISSNSRNIGLAAPLFTSSLASQISQYYSESNPTFARFNQTLTQSVFLRASRPLQFRQTLSDTQSSIHTNYEITNELNDLTLNSEKMPPPSKNKKSKRILQNHANLQNDMRRIQISINQRRDEMLKEEVERQRNSIKICRKYRIGDFPDIEIPHSNLIEPLQELVKNDQIIARELTVAMFCSMLKEMSAIEKTEFLKKLSVTLDFILNNTQGSKPLIATVLEVILNSYEIRIDPNIIAKVSKSCGLLSLGALLLEEKMISGYTIEDSEPVAKRFKTETQTNNAENDWLQLANIYKSLNDFDIVQSIFGCEKFGKELMEASFAQGASNWSTAKVAYESAYDVSEGLVKDYCQESLFTCLAYLSDWKQIKNHVEAELNGNFDILWQEPMNENWMTVWALQAQIHGMVRNDCDDRFLKALNDCVNTKSKLIQVKSLYGEEIAMFHASENPEFSESCVVSALEKIKQEWKHLNPLYYEQKINKYLKLRGLTDIKTYLKGIKDKSHFIINVQCMINSWNNSVPANQDNLLLWDLHVAYRLYFFGLLIQQLRIESSDKTTEIQNVINDAVVKQCLNIAQVAYSQNNLHFVKKYLRYSEQYLVDDNSTSNNEWRLAIARYRYLYYVDSRTQEMKVKNYIASWDESHKLLINESVDTQVQIDARQHISSLSIELQKLIIKSEPISSVLLEDPLISQYLPSKHDQESILKELSDYCLTKLKECCGSGDAKNKAHCYLKMSMYCHSMSEDFKSSLDLSQEFIHSTLSAMSYGSLEATQYFPCLLHLEYSANSELSEIFQHVSANVETWMFLKWQAQLLSHIGTPVSSLIAPILFRLAETYPSAFVYAFRMTKEMNKSLSDHPLIGKITNILSDNKDLELFLEAIKYVVQPELYLKYYVSAIESNTSAAVNRTVNTLLTTVYPFGESNAKTVLQGKAYRMISKFKEKIKTMPKMEMVELLLSKKQIINDLDASLKNRIKDTCSLPLEDYSPWLYNYKGGNIEVPGQYVVDEKPVPQYHAKIVKLYPEVTILPSLRKPIKITMLGNDGKNYSFLLKFGEDLRTDERIEQLFMLINKILQNDTMCRQRQLSIDTYSVIPLTGSLGIIQWLENTRSLNEIIQSILTDQQKSERENIMKLFINWMNNLAAGQSIEAMYSKGILNYNRQEVTTKFERLKNRIDWDILRKAFKQLSASPESFFALRHNFITSYATICIAQWILGIGDRNLSNTLISYTSGKALGIDFGYSFDSAVDSPVPELMPFRLTPQILGLLKPFDENGLLKITMINVLRAIKNGKDPLLACMDIFVKEPSVDWLPRCKVPEDRRDDSDVKWYPKKKINIVVNKLNGTKPSKLTLLQIKDRYDKTDYFRKYIDIINGSEDGLESRLRSKRRDENLSIEEQVECLLDQATDPNILARTWFGWEPWM